MPPSIDTLHTPWSVLVLVVAVELHGVVDLSGAEKPGVFGAASSMLTRVKSNVLQRVEEFLLPRLTTRSQDLNHGSPRPRMGGVLDR